MCYEDIRLGFRRFAKVTASGAGPLAIPGDKGRVVLRVSLTSTVAVDANLTANLGTSVTFAPVMFCNQGRPVDELTFETHGSLVQEAWAFNGSATYVITEIIDRDLAKPPKPGDPLYQTVRD
jgi:hypothetical protein